MPVSDKMAHAICGYFLYYPFAKLKEFLQEGINAAWHRFDPEDPETWPKSEYAPSGLPWLWIKVENGAVLLNTARFIHPEFEYAVLNTVRYCDPADIMPSMED